MLNRASDVHHFALAATARTLRNALAQEDPRCSAAASLALRAIASAFHSDVQGAIALLRRALNSCAAASEDAPYVSDLLAQLLVSTGDFAGVERTLGSCRNVPGPLAPSILALDAILHAMLGDAAGSRMLARTSITSARQHDNPRAIGQVLCRCSLAAYYRGDYDEGRDLALDAARHLESERAYIAAAAAYSVAGSIAQDWHKNGRAASAHYSRMRELAQAAGHKAIGRSALAACFNVAAEMFDQTTHAAMRTVLITRPAPEQLQESFTLAVGDVLGFGWKGDFASAEAVLVAYAGLPARSDPQRALIDAFLALIAAANWDVELARVRSRRALELTARLKREPLYERHSRELARLLAAAACFIIGDIVRGERALSRRYDANHEYRALLASGAIGLSRCPELFRGYAEFINVASARARLNRPRYGLTPAEAALLGALPQGLSVSELAIELNKSKHTIARQIESIYHKLGARNRAQAVQKARAVGLLP